MGLVISTLGLAIVGCGTLTGKVQQQNQVPTSNTQQQNQVTNPEPKAVYLTPVPKGTPLITANNEVSKQLMGQKDVIGTQIYDQKGIVYGEITFESGVAKDYAHNLANEFLYQLKVSYPGRMITTQAVSDGKNLDSISFTP